MAVIEPIRRAFAVLEALNRRRATTLSLLAAETGLPRPTLVRLLQTLIELGYASRVSREAGYRLTDQVLTLAGGVRFIDHLVDSTSELWSSERPVSIEKCTRLAEVDAVPDGQGAHLDENCLERLGGANAAVRPGGEATRGDRFAVQLVVHKVDGVLDNPGVGVVVLGAEPYRRIRGGKRAAERNDTRVYFLGVGTGEHGQVEFEEIQDGRLVAVGH